MGCSGAGWSVGPLWLLRPRGLGPRGTIPRRTLGRLLLLWVLRVLPRGGSKLLGHLLLLLRLLLVVLRPSRSRSCCCSCSKPRRPKQVQVTCGRLLRCLDIAVRRYHKCRSGCSWLLLLLLGLLLSTPWYGGAITGLLGSAPESAIHEAEVHPDYVNV